MRLFVGNISFDLSEFELQRWLEGQGHTVTDVRVVRDHTTGHSRGFAFVEVQDGSDLATTINRLNGQKLGGRALTVNAATPKGSNKPVADQQRS